MTPREQILAKCKEVCELALRLYGVDLSRVPVRFDLKGRAAGMACWQRRNGVSTYWVRFNNDMMQREAMDHVLNNTVPHEYAHILCFMNPALGKNHDAGWERVCLRLGGTGRTRHNEDIVMGKGITYEYTTDNGNKVRVGDKHHRSIQLGATIKFRKGLGSVTAACAYSIVGVQGRTLAAPIPKQPTMAVAPVQAVQPVARPALVPVLAPRAPTLAPVFQRVQVTAPAAGESKASISRRIMLQGYRAGSTYETIIAAMQAANGYDRQLARGTFKANAPKIGIPASFYS